MRHGHLTLLVVLLLIALASGASLLYASDGSSVPSTATQSITAFGVCKKVTNTSPTGKTVYVPTQSAAEWTSFYSNPPAGVAIGSCVQYLYGGIHTDVDCAAIGGNVVQIGSDLLCNYPASTCPSGWTAYGEYTITQSVSCSGCSGWRPCSTGGHSTFSNEPIYCASGSCSSPARERCSYTGRGVGRSCTNKLCWATVTNRACY